MLRVTGTCKTNENLHTRCTNNTWRAVCKLSFPNDHVEEEINHGPVVGSFEEWFQSWDRTFDPDVHRLCEISWNASRALLPRPLVVKGGAPHGYGIMIDGSFYRVDFDIDGEIERPECTCHVVHGFSVGTQVVRNSKCLRHGHLPRTPND